MKQFTAGLAEALSQVKARLGRLYRVSAYRTIASVALLGVGTVLLVAVASCCIQRVVINDDGNRRTVFTVSHSVEHILSDAGIALMADDEVDVTLNDTEKRIDIQRAFDVSITLDNRDTTVVRMIAGTVADALELAGMSTITHKVIDRKSDEVLTDTTALHVEKLLYTDRTLTEVIPFDVIEHYSDEVFAGKKVVTQEGADGQRTTVYRDYLQNGTVSHTQVLSDTITTSPVNKIITIGTGPMSKAPEGVLLDEKGMPINYKKVINGTATAYTTKPGEPHLTSLGDEPEIGTIAVNPKVIPYGTKLFVVSLGGYVYGYGVAGDTGGALMKNQVTVDLYMNNRKDCYEFGRRPVKIYVLE